MKKKIVILTIVLASLISLISLPIETSAKTIKQFEAEVNKYTAELNEVKSKMARNDAEIAAIKKKIAREFNLPQHLVLENWMKCLVNLRNCIAHHARVWNRNFPSIPQIDIPLRGNWIHNSNLTKVKLYPQVCLIEYLIQNINLESKFKNKLIELLHNNPNIDIKAMGFPINWQNEPLWK